MSGRAQVEQSEIVGREHELAVVRAFVTEGEQQSAVVVGGAPGMGKTTLWEAGLDGAFAEGVAVLHARPTDAEAQLGFTALTDLLDGVELESLRTVPDPQRRALEAALLRIDAPAATPDRRAIGLGLLGVLRELAERGPVLVAIDDVQWLDAPSRESLVFAVRRLDGAPVRLLLATRPGGEKELEPALARWSVESLEVGPLSLGATRRLLGQRLGLSLPRRVLRRIHEASLGSPMFVLELGRALGEGSPLAPGEDIPVPDGIDDLVGTRVGSLPDVARTTLLALALNGDLHRAQVDRVVGDDAIDVSLQAGVVLVEGQRIRPAHPLLASAAKLRSTPAERRVLHLALAQAVSDGELRVRHLALATGEPDETLAEGADRAAATAAARGAALDAVDFARHALRLTPPDSPCRSGRVLALGRYLQVAGESKAISELLAPEVDSLPTGEPRVRAYLLLCHGGAITTNAEIRAYLDRALAEAGDEQRLRATVLGPLASNVSSIDVERIPEAEGWALEALDAAPDAGLDVERDALYALGWVRALRGRPIDDVVRRFVGASATAFYVAQSPERAAVQRLVWRGELEHARIELRRLLALADEQGEPESYALLRLHLCELELRAGGWAIVARHLDEWGESADQLLWPMYERCRALLEAGRGNVAEAERWGGGALAAAERTGNRWDLLQTRRALATAALARHDPAAAAAHLIPVWDHACHAGIEDPGAFPVSVELVEALLDLEQCERAAEVTARLRRQADEQAHPWGRASVVGCEAMVGLALRYDDDRAAAVAAAAEHYGSLGLRFDRARALLRLGRTQRRYRKWGAARASLEAAAEAFAELGSPGWAEDARSELGRVGARRRRPAGELTPAERRAAELAAEGMSNNDIARALVVSPHTVEAHLSRAYAKLGIRGRSQLATSLGGRVKE